MIVAASANPAGRAGDSRMFSGRTAMATAASTGRFTGSGSGIGSSMPATFSASALKALISLPSNKFTAPTKSATKRDHERQHLLDARGAALARHALLLQPKRDVPRDIEMRE